MIKTVNNQLLKTVKELKPIELNDYWERRIKSKINKFFIANLFAQITAKIQKSKKLYFNEKRSTLAQSFIDGKLQFANGIIKGQFNAALSRELKQLGLKFDSRIKGYKIDIKNLPFDVQSAIGQARINFQNMQRDIVNLFDNLNYQEALKELNFSEEYLRITNDIDKQFFKTTAKVIGVSPEISEVSKLKIAEEYSNNLKLYIKDFLDKEVLELRKSVVSNTYSGYRAEYLQKVIKERYNVSERKAKFLARQETNLITAKYRESRYLDAGIEEYMWSSAGDGLVREDHKELNGKVFRFDSPPIVNKETGKRANPSEDFNCRCKARPLVRIKSLPS